MRASLVSQLSCQRKKLLFRDGGGVGGRSLETLNSHTEAQMGPSCFYHPKLCKELFLAKCQSRVRPQMALH